ncbi:cell division cycle-associated protein 3 [Betta splendens]|uniref:Cell division cycle-associated protein 3 n=1 Tax=Betta splendens TaxID=158456 RepID=A0A6P7KW98_BETSP|nr:cell division cycle-associated protein 3 [Betta splendens]
MGSSESKIAVAAPVNAAPAIKNTRVTCLLDPRSPSANLARTPIQIGEPESVTSAVVQNVCHPAMVDPRSPTVGITRTPVREVMRAKVGSFARRLGMLFYHDTEYKAPQEEEEEVFKREELASTEPLLSPQSSKGFGTMAMHANLLATPVRPPVYSSVDSSPFVLLQEHQVEVDIEAEADISLEEAEEAKESPLHKRLSMSLITCHEGATSSQIFAEVHRDCASPVPSAEVETFGAGVDHSYARPSLEVKPESAVEPSPNTQQDESPAQSSAQIIEAEALPSEERRNSDSTEAPSAPVTAPPTVPGPEQPQHKGIRCPTFDPKSPSQVVFKPQWLGKDFGAAGLRARGVQGHGGKGSSSPLALRIAVKTVTNENRRQSGKLKQKGTEGRSPLQILKETNSPRDQHSQLKLKASTPNKQRLGHMDSRALAVALDKENR